MNFGLEIVPYSEAALRVFIACVIGFILGFDRAQKAKPMGYRTYIIVAVTTCLLAIMGQEIYADYSDVKEVLRIDLGKIISGVVTGIGFLGAGAIIRDDKNQIIGSATGASIWASGGIGLMLGFGFYSLAVIGFMTIFFVLAYLHRIVDKVTGNKSAP